MNQFLGGNIQCKHSAHKHTHNIMKQTNETIRTYSSRMELRTLGCTISYVIVIDVVYCTLEAEYTDRERDTTYGLSLIQAHHSHFAGFVWQRIIYKLFSYWLRMAKAK